MNIIYDTHCHPQLKQYDLDREEVIQRALDANIKMICIGVDLETSKQAIELAEKYDSIFASVGLHPNDNLDEVYDQQAYLVLVRYPKVVAVGEVGLDYYRTTEEDKKKFQRERFLNQIDLAIELDKPLIIHCRDAHGDMVEILSASHKIHGQKLRGVIHSFTGSYDDAKKYIELGFYIGVNGISTFTEQYNETFKNIPVDKLLVETDAPYLSPVPFRGKRNEPSYVVEVVKKLSELRNVPFDDLAKTLENNTKALFSV